MLPQRMIEPARHDKHEEQENETKTYLKRCESWIEGFDLQLR